ncbi:MAG: 6-carboxytetrahydropterin synthase [Gemmatimonadales bacterium]|nr:MAG: 6-carboxytetrahydropterin synthase [Gemmatimonadales bacterium]
MSRASLLRVVTFRATHRYGVSSWSEAENTAAFGGLMDIHEHTFRVEVVVEGIPHPVTGFVIDLPAMDRILLEEVLGPLDGSHLNDSVPEFREGLLQPTTEALARWIGDRIRARISPPIHLRRVRVWESDDLAGEVRFEP